MRTIRHLLRHVAVPCALLLSTTAVQAEKIALTCNSRDNDRNYPVVIDTTDRTVAWDSTVIRNGRSDLAEGGYCNATLTLSPSVAAWSRDCFSAGGARTFTDNTSIDRTTGLFKSQMTFAGKDGVLNDSGGCEPASQ